MIKTALFHTIRLIEDYQYHSPMVYNNVEEELNDLKKQMEAVINLLDKKAVA